MLDKLTVFDIETPSCHQDRICAIGIVRIEAGNVVFSESFLVDPECEFSPMNVRVHGIRPEDVRGCPTFPELWARFEPLFYDGVVAAHNAGFDLSVLGKTLSHYGLALKPLLYLDTCAMVYDFYPDAPCTRLDSVCGLLDIHLEHHNAGSDAEAAAEVVLDMLRRGLSNDQVRSYEFGVGSFSESSGFKRSTAVTRGIRELNKLLRRLTADGKIDAWECAALFDWMREHSEFLGNYPFDDIYARLESILEDGVAEAEELDSLLTLINAVMDPVAAASCSGRPRVQGLNVVLTGNFSRGEKQEIAAELAAQGALIQKDVTKKTRLLIVGSLGSEQWSAGVYGNKVKRAMEMQGAGLPIRIMREDDFFNSEEVDDMEQIGFIENAEDKEQQLADAAQRLRLAIEPHLAGLGDLAKKITVTVNVGYVALKAGSSLAAQIAFRRKGVQLSVKPKYCELLPGLAWETANSGLCRTRFNDLDELLALGFILCEIAVKSLPAGEGFGCCHLYEKCSDAKACVQPDKLFALACYYKKNLEQGRIFYGKNKNI